MKCTDQQDQDRTSGKVSKVSNQRKLNEDLKSAPVLRHNVEITWCGLNRRVSVMVLASFNQVTTKADLEGGGLEGSQPPPPPRWNPFFLVFFSIQLQLNRPPNPPTPIHPPPPTPTHPIECHPPPPPVSAELDPPLKAYFN